MIRTMLLACLTALTSCSSDAEQCVDAQMEAFDAEYPAATPDERDEARTFAAIECAGE